MLWHRLLALIKCHSHDHNAADALNGLDPKKLSYKRNGTGQVLVENAAARVVTELLA